MTPAEVERLGDERGALITRVNDRREIETAEDVEVSFADPDDAVRERVREMGLSEAGLDIDDAVRDPELAESNVRDRVRQRVEAVLDGDDDDSAGETADTADPETPEDPNAGEEPDDQAQATTMEEFQ